MNTTDFGNANGFASDGVGGLPNSNTILGTFGTSYMLIGVCDQPTAGNFIASIEVRGLSGLGQMDVDGDTGFNAVDHAVGVGNEVPMISTGAATSTHKYLASDYSVMGVNAVGGHVDPISGVVSVALGLGTQPCRFSMTAIGGPSVS